MDLLQCAFLCENENESITTYLASCDITTLNILFTVKLYICVSSLEGPSPSQNNWKWAVSLAQASQISSWCVLSCPCTIMLIMVLYSHVINMHEAVHSSIIPSHPAHGHHTWLCARQKIPYV